MLFVFSLRVFVVSVSWRSKNYIAFLYSLHIITWNLLLMFCLFLLSCRVCTGLWEQVGKCWSFSISNNNIGTLEDWHETQFRFISFQLEIHNQKSLNCGLFQQVVCRLATCQFFLSTGDWIKTQCSDSGRVP